ncbi:MAG: tetratricopeptide repeat-containing sulfotransferase family protein [Aestuariivirgaceae bacterium]
MGKYDSSAEAARDARLAVDAGNLTTATRLFRIAVKLDKHNPQVLLEAGVAAAQCGDIGLARQYLTRAAELDDRSADAHFNLGHVYLTLNDYGRALHHLETASALDKDYPDIDYSLAEALFGLGQTQTALRHAAISVGRSPLDLDAWMLKARCEDRLRLHDELVATLTHLLQLSPGHLDGRFLLARHYASRFLSAKAAEQLKHIEALSDLPTSAVLQLGDIYGACGFAGKAAAAAERILKVDAGNAAAQELFASAQIDLGNFDLAERTFRHLLQSDPDRTLAYQGLADVKRLSEDDREALEKLYRNRKLTNQQRAHCGFALYYLNDKAAQYQAAFEALSTANRMLREDSPQDVFAAQSILLRLRDILSKQALDDRTGQGYAASGPVFIIGMPRSGTTLVEQLLASHRDVHAGGERSDVTELRRSITGFPDGIAGLDAAWARPAGEQLHAAMFDGAQGKSLATDKLPGNYAFVGLIKWVLPGAKFVYCRRRPEANALSLFEQHFSSLPFSRDLVDIAAAYNAHLKIMHHWRDECGIEVFEVDYDRLVQDPAPLANELYAHLGLEWRDEYLDITRISRPINTASRWQARQPISTGSVERWRRYEKQLQPFVEALTMDAGPL